MSCQDGMRRTHENSCLVCRPGPFVGTCSRLTTYGSRQRMARPVHLHHQFHRRDCQIAPCAHMLQATAVMGPSTARADQGEPVSYTHLRAHETPEHLVCRLLL